MYVLSTGRQWRYIPKDLPPRSTVNGYVCLWDWGGTLETIHHSPHFRSRFSGGPRKLRQGDCPFAVGER